MKRLVTDPPFFVEVIKLVFMTEAESKAKEEGARPEPDQETLRYAEHAYRMLSALRRSPGLTDEGAMEADRLREWVNTTRALLAEADRAAIGDQRIGHALWYAPPGEDGIHPHESVRQLIEDVASDELELGFHVEAVNSRGAHFRRGDGGEEERELAQLWDERANAVAASWPRTAAVFRGIANDYRAWAERWDNETRLREDTWS
jgi:hypothetical protein